MPWKNTGSKTKPPTPAQCDTEFLFLTEIDSLALANAQLNLNKIYQNFFPRAKQKIGKVGFPKWKNRKNPVQSYTTIDQKGSVTIFMMAVICNYLNSKRLSKLSSIVLLMKLSNQSLLVRHHQANIMPVSW